MGGWLGGGYWFFLQLRVGVGAKWTKRRTKSWMRSRTTDVDVGNHMEMRKVYNTSGVRGL